MEEGALHGESWGEHPALLCKPDQALYLLSQYWPRRDHVSTLPAWRSYSQWAKSDLKMGKRTTDGPVRYQPRPGHCISSSKSYIKKQTQKTETGDNCEVSALNPWFLPLLFLETSRFGRENGYNFAIPFAGTNRTQWLPPGCATEQTLLCVHMSWFAFLTHTMRTGGALSLDSLIQ